MPSISTRDLVMMLVGLGEGHSLSEGLGGITRLQKYLFLLEKEAGVVADGNGFRFEAYKAGPYSAKLYDDLEFLENLGLLESRVTGNASEPEAVELQALTFDDLLGEQTDAHPTSASESAGAAFEERAFLVTDRGVSHVRELLDNPAYQPVVDGIRRVKSRFAKHSLNDLLRYVYQKYPEMTTESEIREKVFGRRNGR